MSTTSATQSQDGSLTKRSGLTFVSNVMQLVARFAVSFFVTPIIITGLGASLYGAWVIMQQTVGYLALSDLRPMGTLKFTLAINQHLADFEGNQRQIGASLIMWALTLPIFLTLGALTIWFAPSLIQVEPEHISAVRVALAIMIFTLMMERVITLPSIVLRGVNLEYKFMGINAATILVGGSLSALVIWTSWGIVGLAIAALAGMLLTNIIRYWVARRVLSWFRAKQPKRVELKKFISLSVWLFFSASSGLLLTGFDLMLVGYVLGPSMAAIYATTGAAIRLLIEPLSMLVSSGSPGMVGLCGRREWRRVEALRTELHIVTLFTLATIGCGVVALNESFLILWVGPGYWGGNALTLIFVLTAILAVIFRIDAVFIDGMLEFRTRAWTTLSTGISAIVSGLGLAVVFGMTGFACGFLIGYLLLFLHGVFFLRRRIQLSVRRYVGHIARLTGVMMLLLTIAYLLAPNLHAHSWLQFFVLAVAVVLASGVVMWVAGMSRYSRQLLLGRSMHMVRQYMHR